MSAYVNGRVGQVYPLNNPSGLNSNGQLEQLPTLPQIAHELEAYFAIARSIESTLVQERASARQCKEELQDLQHKYNRLSAEVENKIREFTLREERLKSQINTHQQTERGLHEQINELCKQVEMAREDKKKTEMDTELMRANVENFKRREQSLKFTLHSLTASDKSRVDQIEKLSHELQAVRAELNRYQSAWARVVEIDRKSKSILEDYHVVQKKLHVASEELKIEKQRREALEEAMKKEKREKQIALSCLHTAEAKLNQTFRDLEERKKEKPKTIQEEGLELNF